MVQSPLNSDSKQPLVQFLFLGGLLCLLRIALGFLRVPEPAADALSVASAAVFIAVPVLAVYKGSKLSWTGLQATALFVIGVALHVGGVFLVSRVLAREGAATVVVESLGQFGLLCWCMGLGALVALQVKDRNLLLPMVLFLAGFDVFLVSSPNSPLVRFMAQQPKTFGSVAMSVPSVQPQSPEPSGVMVVPQAFVGPADLMFSAVFLVAIARFGMRHRETGMWLAPVLLAYLFVALMFGALPALVPIGATVLLVNARQFKFSRQEVASTWVVGLVSLGLAIFAVSQRMNANQAVPSAPSTSAVAPPDPAQGATPPPVPQR